MKKNIKFILLPIVFVLLNFSCENIENNLIEPPQNIDSELLIKIAKDNMASFSRNMRGSSETIWSPRWDLSVTLVKQNGNSIVITPLYGNIKVNYTNNPGYFRRLVTEIDKKNQVKNTEVYEIIGDIGFILSNYKLLIDNSNPKRFKEFKGGILITDYYSKVKYGKQYSYERVTGNIDLKVRTKNRNSRTASEQCWGMFLTTTYEDGSQSEVMLYSWCVNSDPNPNDQQGPDHGSSGGDVISYDKDNDTVILPKCSGVELAYKNSFNNDGSVYKESHGFWLANGSLLLYPQSGNSSHSSSFFPGNGDIFYYVGPNGDPKVTYKDGFGVTHTEVVQATFHTHPNSGYCGPSTADINSAVNQQLNIPDIIIGSDNVSYKSTFSNGQYTGFTTSSGKFSYFGCN